MSDEDANKQSHLETESVPSKKILLLIIALIVLGSILWISFNFLNGWSTEGNPNIYFSEINDTLAASHKISHLTPQEYQEFPKLKEAVAYPQADRNWTNGYRYLSKSQITEQQKDFITGKYANDGYYMGYLEYQGRYYKFAISLP
jgi:hypothetical protein